MTMQNRDARVWWREPWQLDPETGKIFPTILVVQWWETRKGSLQFQRRCLVMVPLGEQRQPMVLWEEMKILILWQFRATQIRSLHEQWLALEQESTIHEYCRRFTDMTTPLENISDDPAVGKFIKGLQPDIAVELRLFEPNSLGRATDLAQKIENKILLVKKRKGLGLRAHRILQMPCSTSGNPMQQTSPHTRATTPLWSTNLIWRLIDAEAQSKLERGLCYRCD